MVGRTRALSSNDFVSENLQEGLELSTREEMRRREVSGLKSDDIYYAFYV